MTTITFEARLKADGSLMVPHEASAELGLHPGDQVRVQLDTTTNDEAPRELTMLERAVQAMTSRTPEQLAAAQAHAMEAFKPFLTVPPGKTLADIVSGKWPGDETDEQIKIALEELS